MLNLAMEEERCPELTADDRALWCEEIELRCGISFSETRSYVLRRALLRGMARQGIAVFRDYFRLVTASAAEWNALLEDIVNRETSFFRHEPSFQALSLDLLPRLMAARRKSGGEELRLWSAGCSTGEEPYSMALAAAAALPDGAPIQVLGSDVSMNALAAARRARYSERAVADVPEAIRRRWLAKDGSEYLVDPRIRAGVRFERFNFFEPATYPAVPQDVIFCQNVLIYFRAAARAKVVSRLAERLRPGGCLVPAPGELAGLRVAGLECRQPDGQAVYWRT